MDSKVEELINRLIERTKAGQVSWSTSDLVASFIYYSPSGSVVIDSVDQDGQYPFRFRILNQDGIEIASVETGRDFEEMDDEDTKEHNLLNELYELARRDALSIDQVLDDLLSEMKKED